jgi:hypothetical protein
MHRGAFPQAIAEAERNCSRSTNFWIFPVEVFGK